MIVLAELAQLWLATDYASRQYKQRPTKANRERVEMAQKAQDEMETRLHGHPLSDEEVAKLYNGKENKA